MGTFAILHWHTCSECTWRDLFSQNDTTYRGRPRLLPASCDQCTFLTFWPKILQLPLDGQVDKQTYIFYFPHLYKSQTNLKSRTSTKRVEGTKDNQGTKLNNRRLVGVHCFWVQGFFFGFSLPPRLWDRDGWHLPPFLSLVQSNRISVQRKIR